MSGVDYNSAYRVSVCDTGKSMELPPTDKLLASAINFLIQGEEHDAATMLLFCDADIHRQSISSGFTDTVDVVLSGPRHFYDAMNDDSTTLWDTVATAFRAVLPVPFDLRYLQVRAQLIDVDPNWREELREAAVGRGAHNQGVEIPDRKTITWKNLRFRSESERRIAVALDTARVLYLPNCLARLSTDDDRMTREADFLVCHEGKWGVLEVDGPFHPRAVLDHERDRLFQQHGIRVTQRFDWQDCLNDAPGVVHRFLILLKKNG